MSTFSGSTSKEVLLATTANAKGKTQDYQYTIEDNCTFSKKSDFDILVIANSDFSLDIIEDAATSKPDVWKVRLLTRYESPLNGYISKFTDKDNILSSNVCYWPCLIRFCNLL